MVKSKETKTEFEKIKEKIIGKPKETAQEKKKLANIKKRKTELKKELKSLLKL